MARENHISSKEENRKRLVDNAKCIKEMIEKGKDGFACRRLIELTLIR